MTKSKFPLNESDFSLSPEFKAQLEKCPLEVKEFVSHLISRLKNCIRDNAKILAISEELKARLELCEEGIIERKTTDEELSKLPPDELEKRYHEKFQFDNKLGKKISLSKSKKK